MTSFGGVALTGNTIEEHVRTAVEAEKCGYDTAWMAEVFGPDAVTVLAASAVATSRIRLATGIVSTYVRHALKAPWYVDLLNINLDNHDLAEARRRIGMCMEALTRDGERITKNLDFDKPAA